jgi:hypothetical protein
MALLLVANATITANDESENLTDESPSFSGEVRGLLSNHCFACHGPDEEKREAGLRLDLPGEADFDDVLERLVSDDPELRMPPPEANKPLNQTKIELLTRWIEAGAQYEEHWAFVAPEKPGVPDGQHPVDHFVDASLKHQGLHRSPPADPLTLVRRVYLDLIGLPPTPEQADAFAADPSQQAYEKMVDELLASDAYGERWARRWLDLARYADTNGYEKDRDRSIWPYRDWVIRAINDGLPFDQFTIQQIAGDLLPDAGADQLIATGFHRNTMLNEEGGIDPLEFRYHAMTDRVATTGTTWLGLTTGCAQCHTHKYDPITHHDYFGMLALLNNVDEPNFYIRTDESIAVQKKRLAEANKIIAELESHWPQPTATQPPPTTFDEAFAQWWTQQRENAATWTVLTADSLAANVPYLTQEPNGIVIAAGDTSKHDIYTLKFPATDTAIAAIRLETLPDERLPAAGPGMTYYEGREGDFFLSELEISLTNDAPETAPTPVNVAAASQTYAKNSFGNHQGSAAMAVDGDLQTGWSVAERAGLPHIAVFELQQPIAANTPFEIRMHFGRHFASSLGKFRISATSMAGATAKATLLDAELLKSLDPQTAKSSDLVRAAFLQQTDQLADTAAKWIRLRQTAPGVPTLIMRERPAAHTRPTYLHHRGEYTQPKEQVEPRVPEALRAAGQPSPQNRLEFARWLVSRENPLTARVVANRHWAAFFGTGIVSTLDDFGGQGQSPSHPELLDFLAVELMDNQWQIKQLHRLIVTSGTYRQSSAMEAHGDHPEADRLLSRFPRTRLEAEVIRDTSLAAAGLLERKMFGPPVRPPQPQAAQAANYKRSTWQASTGVDRFRRSIYTYQQRTAPFAMFTTFDAGSGEACIAQRDVSNTPLQSLTLMNDPMFVEIATHFGQQMVDYDGDVDAKITHGVRCLLTRGPTDKELAMLREFQQKHDDWVAVARVLLCLDESISKN